MARCGCGTACACTLISSLPDCVTVEGNGSIRLPYAIGLTIDPSVDNLLECGASGLLVDVNNIPAMAVVATDGLDGDGLLATPLVVRYSTDAGNQAAAGTDGGVFVPFPTINTALPVTGDGSSGAPISLLISTDVGNSVSTGTDGGVFVPTGGAATVNTNLPIQGDGSGGTPVDLLISTDGGNIVTLGTDTGVYATVAVTAPCISGDGTGAAPLALVFNANSSIQCGGSGLELDLDGTNGGTSGLSDSAAGLRVAEDTNGTIRRGNGIRNIAPHGLFNRGAGYQSTSDGASNWNLNAMPAGGVNGNWSISQPIDPTFGTFDVASGVFTCNQEGVYLMTVTLEHGNSGNNQTNGYGVDILRNNSAALSRGGRHSVLQNFFADRGSAVNGTTHTGAAQFNAYSTFGTEGNFQSNTAQYICAATDTLQPRFKVWSTGFAATTRVFGAIISVTYLGDAA